MTSEVAFTNLIVVRREGEELTAEKLSQLCKLIARKISTSQKLQLLSTFSHEKIVYNFVVFCL